jgi:hypothetical protein
MFRWWCSGGEYIIIIHHSQLLTAEFVFVVGIIAFLAKTKLKHRYSKEVIKEKGREMRNLGRTLTGRRSRKGILLTNLIV